MDAAPDRHPIPRKCWRIPFEIVVDPLNFVHPFRTASSIARYGGGFAASAGLAREGAGQSLGYYRYVNGAMTYDKGTWSKAAVLGTIDDLLPYGGGAPLRHSPAFQRAAGMVSRSVALRAEAFANVRDRVEANVRHGFAVPRGMVGDVQLDFEVRTPRSAETRNLLLESMEDRKSYIMETPYLAQIVQDLSAAGHSLYVHVAKTERSNVGQALYANMVEKARIGGLHRAATNRDGRSALSAGVLVGLAALTRTEGLLLLPFVALPLLWRQWRLAALAALAAALTVAPWTARNAITLDRFVPVSTNVDTVVAGANCDETYRGRNMGLWSTGCLAAATARELDFPLRSYDEGRLAGVWQSAGREYAADHAGRLPAVAAVRVARLWRLWQPLREADTIEGVGVSAGKVAALSFLLGLLPLGLAAAFRGRLRPDVYVLLLGLAAMVTLTSALGWGAPRFLRPAELGLVLAAGAYLSRNALMRSSKRPVSRE